MTIGKININIAIENRSMQAKGNAELFITEDAALNRLILTITNPSATAVSLSPEAVLTITPPEVLLSEKEVEAVGVKDDQWSFELENDRFTHWTVRPKQNIRLAGGSGVSFELTGITIDKQNLEGRGLYWSIAWAKIAGVISDTVQRQVFVLHPAPQNLPLEFSLSPQTAVAAIHKHGPYIPVYKIPGFPQFMGEIFITDPKTSPIYTRLIVNLTNRGKPIRFSRESQFKLSFVVAGDDCSDLGALARSSAIKDIEVEQQYNDPEKKWQLIRQEGGGSEIKWLLQPGADIWIDSNETVRFQIDVIATNLAPYPTPMHLSSKGIPGYLDGLFSRMLTKVTTPAALTAMSVDGHSILARAGGLFPASLPGPLDVGLKQKVKLGWTTVGVTQADLKPQLGNAVEVPIAGYHDWVPYRQETDIGIVSLVAHPTISIGNTWNFRLQPAQIESLTAEGQNPLHLQHPGTVTIAWKTSYADAVTLKDEQQRVLAHFTIKQNPQEVADGSHREKIIAGNGVFTLECSGYQPKSKQVKVFLPGTASIELHYDPNQGPRGTIAVEYNFTAMDFDEAGFKAVIYLEGIPLCTPEFTIRNSLDPEGREHYPLPEVTPKGCYELKSTTTFLKQGLPIKELPVNFHFTVP